MVRLTVIPELSRQLPTFAFSKILHVCSPPSISSYDMTCMSTTIDMENSPTTHAIFLIPEILIRILLQLPDEDLKTCYCVSPLWGEVLRAHLPLKKLPLPEHLPSHKPLRNKDQNDCLSSACVTLHPSIKLSDIHWPYYAASTTHPDGTRTWSLETAWQLYWTEMSAWECDAQGKLTKLRLDVCFNYHRWLENEDQIWRNTYFADPPPTAVEVRCARDTMFNSYERPWRPTGYTNILKPFKYVSYGYYSPLGGYLRIEREKGVGLGDVLDELNGVIVWDEDACRRRLRRTGGEDMGSEIWEGYLDECKKFVGLKVTMFWGSVGGQN
jgi:hypothetical protein